MTTTKLDFVPTNWELTSDDAPVAREEKEPGP